MTKIDFFSFGNSPIQLFINYALNYVVVVVVLIKTQQTACVHSSLHKKTHTSQQTQLSLFSEYYNKVPTFFNESIAYLSNNIEELRKA